MEKTNQELYEIIQKHHFLHHRRIDSVQYGFLQEGRDNQIRKRDYGKPSERKVHQ